MLKVLKVLTQNNTIGIRCARMKMLNAFLILATILLGITSIIFFAWHDVADAIYALVWAVWMAVLRRIREA
jgi:hypothetical protein